MKIGTIGIDLPHTERFNYKSTTALLDYEVIIIDPGAIISEYTSSPNLRLDQTSSTSLLSDLQRRSIELAEFLQAGRDVVIFLPNPIKYRLYGTRTVEPMDFLGPLRLSLVTGSGTSVEFRGPEVIEKFWDYNQTIFAYRAILAKTSGQPFLYVKGTDRVIGSWLSGENGRGQTLYLPYPRFHQAGGAASTERKSVFKTSLEKLFQELKAITFYKKPPLPEWAESIKLPGVDVLESKLKAKFRQMEEIENEINFTQKHLENIQNLRHLIAGKGDTLHQLVLRVLNEIGLSAVEGPPNRDDINLKYGNHIGVAEVKGTKGSAAEKHVMQLEKWRGEYCDKHSLVPKGFLFINAFAETPLDERNEPAFPEQVCRLAIGRDQCLMTTVQLLGLYLEIKNHPENRDALIHELFGTVGPYQRFLDAAEVLCK